MLSGSELEQALTILPEYDPAIVNENEAVNQISHYLGNIEKAKQLFEAYYQSAVEAYNNLAKNGRKQYLKKGERVVFMGHKTSLLKKTVMLLCMVQTMDT